MYHDYVCRKLYEARVQDFIKEAEDTRCVELCRAEASAAPMLKRIIPPGLAILICLLLTAVLLVR